MEPRQVPSKRLCFFVLPQAKSLGGCVQQTRSQYCKQKPVAAVNLEIKSSKSKTNAVFEIFDIALESALSGTTAEVLGLIVCLDLLKSNTKKHDMHNAGNAETQCVPPGFDEFPDRTRTTGTIPGKYIIKLEPGSKGVIHPVTDNQLLSERK